MKDTVEKDQYGAPISESVVPPKYNTESTMKETVKEGETTLTIELQTK